MMSLQEKGNAPDALSAVRSTQVYVLVCTYVKRRLRDERQVATVLPSYVLWYFKLSQR